MFRKLTKWLICGALLAAAVVTVTRLAQKTVRLVQKENQLLASAGEQAVGAIRSVGEAGQTFLSRAGEKQMTLLLTGIDEGWGATETVMLISVDLEDDAIRVIALDPNTYVQRENGNDRLGAVYSGAHAEALRRGDSSDEAVRKGNIALKGFLKANTGIVIDHYLSLNTEGLVSLVDSVGGVTLKLAEPLDYDDASRDLHIHLSAGEQKLSGSEAADFVRCKSAEIDAPRRFLSAFFKQIKQNLSLSTAIGLLKASYSSFVSDLTLPDLIPLAKGMLSISPSQVKMVTLRGEDAVDESGAPCKLLERRHTVELLEAYLPDGSGFDEEHFDPNGVFAMSGEN